MNIPLELGPGDIVRLDVTDTVLFGFVTYSRPDETSHASLKPWRTGIEIQKVLLGDSDLATLLRTVLEEQMPHVLVEAGR